MKRQQLLGGLVIVGLIAGSGFGIYRVGMQRGMTMASSASNTTTSDVPAQAGAIPQSVAEGEDATRRHITAGIKAGTVLPRPHGAGQQVRQARQVPLHGHDAGVSVCRWGWGQ